VLTVALAAAIEEARLDAILLHLLLLLMLLMLMLQLLVAATVRQWQRLTYQCYTHWLVGGNSGCGRGRLCGIPTDGSATRICGSCQLLIVVGQRRGNDRVATRLTQGTTAVVVVAVVAVIAMIAVVSIAWLLLLLLRLLLMTNYRCGSHRGVVAMQVQRRKVRGITGVFGLTSADREISID